MDPIRKVGLIANPHKEGARSLAGWLIERLGGRGVEVLLAPETAELLGVGGGGRAAGAITELSGTDLVIVLGGDGTLLHAIREMEGAPAPLLGVNVGSLGFLTEISAGELKTALDRVLAGECRVVSRPLLQGRVEDGGGRACHSLLALNDLVVDEGSPVRRAVLLRMKVGGEEVGTFTADGVVVATPAGSTAYNLSAGGPVLGPDVKALVATPICPHTMSVRPFVFPDTHELVLEDLRPGLNVKITADGQVNLLVPEGGRVRMTAPTDRVARFISLDRHSFYDVLRTKLHWGFGKNAC